MCACVCVQQSLFASPFCLNKEDMGGEKEVLGTPPDCRCWLKGHTDTHTHLVVNLFVDWTISLATLFSLFIFLVENFGKAVWFWLQRKVSLALKETALKATPQKKSKK